MPPIGKALQRVEGLVWGDQVKDTAAYFQDNGLVVDAYGRDAGKHALLVRGLAPASNAPTELFRVNKDGAVSWTGATSFAGDVAVTGNLTVGGTSTLGGAVTVSSGGIAVTGNSSINGTLGGLTGLTVVSGGASIAGATTITGPLGGLTGLTVASGGATINGNATINGTLGGVTGLTVPSGGATVTGGLTVDGVNVGDAAATARANLLTNGGFEVNQRGGTVTATNAYAHDRWQLLLGGTSTATVTDETALVDTGSGHALKAVYVHGSGLTYIDQKIEDYAGLRGRMVTFAVRVRKGAAASVRAYVQDSGTRLFGVTTATTGAYATISATVLVGAAATGVTVGVELSASDTVYLDNAVLVVGATAPTYVPLHPADEMQRCQRYYEVMGGTAALALNAYSGAGAILTVTHRYRAVKPITPTVLVNGSWAVSNCTQPTVSTIGLDSFTLSATVTATGAAAYNPNSTDDTITVESNP